MVLLLISNTMSNFTNHLCCNFVKEGQHAVPVQRGPFARTEGCVQGQGGLLILILFFKEADDSYTEMDYVM